MLKDSPDEADVVEAELPSKENARVGVTVEGAVALFASNEKSCDSVEPVDPPVHAPKSPEKKKKSCFLLYFYVYRNRYCLPDVNSLLMQNINKVKMAA